MPAEVIIHAEPDEKVEAFAKRLLIMTWTFGIPITGRFNDCWLHANMGMTTKQVLEPWCRMNFDRYFGRGEWNRRRQK